MPKSRTIKNQNPGLTLIISFLILFAVNSLVILLANNLFPEHVVLGTFCITKTWAVIHSMSTLALIDVMVIPLVKEYEKLSKKMLSNNGWMFLYFFVNLVAIWVISRFAEELGLGIKSWRIALMLAFAFDVVQSISMTVMKKMKS